MEKTQKMPCSLLLC